MSQPRSKTIKLTLNPKQVELLRRFLATGLYGSTLEEAVERILSRALWEEIIRKRDQPH